MVARWSGMRIVALPLTTRATNSNPRAQLSNAILPLTYYHFQPPSQLKNDDSKGKKSIVQRVTSKAAETWASFGNAPQGNWKRRVFVYGGKLIDRIDFEELSLQGLDPSLGPRIGQLRRGEPKENNSLIQVGVVSLFAAIPMYYPPSVDLGHQSKSPLPHMQSVLARRTPHHRKGFYRWLIIAPLTAPLALIPIIPNFPFFYAAWRAWSHYRAWKASEYLQGLITSNHVLPQPSPELDEVYAFSALPETLQDMKSSLAFQSNQCDSNSQSSTPSRPRLLLSGEAIPRILAIFKLPESAGSSILRAIGQAKVRIDKS